MGSRLKYTYRRFGLPLLVVASVALAGSLPAKADLVISVGSAVVNPGTSGNSFDLTLTNTSLSAVDLGAFSFGISVTNPDITFTEANESTALTYVFAGDSLFGPVISTSPPGQSLIASDLSLSGTSLGTGATFGLGHVLFDVAGGAGPGLFAVTLDGFPATSLSDTSANNLNFTGIDGSITINAVANVPEPSSLLVLLAAAPLLWGGNRFRRKNS